MDIDYLLALQNLRQSMPGFVELFFSGISFIADGPALIAISLIIYWCIDKRIGLFSAMCMAAGNFVCQLLKNIACVYRPWVRDARIIPAESALEGAGGYSFPSGHSSGVTTSLGSIAWLVRKKHRVITAVFVVVIVLVVFSRNLLGVHTPQDVIVGVAVGIAMIALTQLFFNWLERYDALEPGHNKDIVVMVIVVVVSAASVAFVMLKPYPMDYVDGQLLVDPETMMKGSFEAAGLMAGLAIGWVLERRFVGFTTDSSIDTRTRVIRGVVGVGIVGVTFLVCEVGFKLLLPYLWAKLFSRFVLVVVALVVAPIAFSALEKRRAR